MNAKEWWLIILGLLGAAVNGSVFRGWGSCKVRGWASRIYCTKTVKYC